MNETILPPLFKTRIIHGFSTVDIICYHGSTRILTEEYFFK